LVLVSSNYTITMVTPGALASQPVALSITATATGKVWWSGRSIPHLHRHRWTHRWRFHHQHHRKHAPPVSVGTYTITSISCCWCWSSNYTITYNTALFSITAKALEHHRHCHRQGPWRGDPSLTYTVTGLLAHDQTANSAAALPIKAGNG
jgi:hypothetical protein